MVVTGRNVQEVRTRANETLQCVVQWMKDRRLEVSARKTIMIPIAGRRKTPQFSFELKGTEVALSRKAKYLGVWLSSWRGFSTHVKELVRKAKRVTLAVCRLMANVGGAQNLQAAGYCCHSHFSMLYAAPVSSETLGVTRNRMRWTRLIDG